MQLIIAEKPSVGEGIAAIVGANQKHLGYLEGNGYLVSWCMGHLIELAMPQDYDPKYKTWRTEDLPIIPSPFKTNVTEKKSAQFHVLKSLMMRPDVTELIEATDAGREGELIFRLVYNQVGCTKPFKRLWISSMEESAILNGLNNLHPSSDYDNLYHAAVARQQADWLVGINASRLYTSLYRELLTIGRVQTPTLQLVVERDHQRAVFQPEKYYRLHADFGGWRLHRNEQKKEEAESLQKSAVGSEAEIKDLKRETKKEQPPALYDLTTLQRDANRLLGYTAMETLDIAQSLYEKRLQTYPRTDSRYLTHEMEDSTKELLDTLWKENCWSAIKKCTDGNWNVKRTINDSKVGDHHALLPTPEATSDRVAALPERERNILTLVTLRLFAAVSGPHIYHTTKVIAEICGKEFDGNGQQNADLGYTKLDEAHTFYFGTTKKGRRGEAFPDDLAAGQRQKVIECSCDERETLPPPQYTEDTLLSAMETAGRDLDDPALREAMRGSGLGTPATRAGIIENLIHTKYVQREKNALVPTERGKTIIGMVDPRLKSPELTADWERTLSNVATGKRDANKFLQDVIDFTKIVIQQGCSAYDPKTAELIQGEKYLGTCPFCSRPVQEWKYSYSCEGWKDKSCDFSIWKEICGKKITPTVVRALLRDKKSSLIKGFTSKAGKSFDAYLCLGPDGKINFEFPPRPERKMRYSHSRGRR